MSIFSKNHIKIISCLLAIVFCLSIFLLTPAKILAASTVTNVVITDQSESEENSFDSKNGTELEVFEPEKAVSDKKMEDLTFEEREILREIKTVAGFMIPEDEPEKIDEKSDEYNNTYLNPDGSYTLVSYLSPVNFYNDNNELIEIESDIIAADANLADKGYSFASKTGPVKVLLPDNLVSGVPVEIDHKDYSLRMRPLYDAEKQQRFSLDTQNEIPFELEPSPTSTSFVAPTPTPSPFDTPVPSSEPSLTPVESPSPIPVETPMPVPTEILEQPSDAPTSGMLEDAGSANIQAAEAPAEIQPAMEVETAPIPTQTPSQQTSAAEKRTENTNTLETASPNVVITDSNQLIETPQPSIIEEVAAEYSAKRINVLHDYQGNTVEFTKDAAQQKALNDGIVEEKTTALEYLSQYDTGITVRYAPFNQGIKEDIILSEYTGQNSFDFLISVDNMAPEFVEETGAILFKDLQTGEVVSYIPAPYMFDSFEGVMTEEEMAAGDIHFSEAVYYTLQGTETPNEYILTITADEAFLMNPSTIYPVTIDPTVIYQGSKVADLSVYSGLPNSSFFTEEFLSVGYWPGRGHSRAIINFDYANFLNTIRGMKIKSAWLNAGEIDGKSWLPATIGVYRLTGGWTANTTWNTQPATEAGAWAYSQVHPGGREYFWDLKTLMENYAAGTKTYLGIQLAAANEQDSTYWRRFWASDKGIGNAMRLELTYADETGPNAPTGINLHSSSWPGPTGWLEVSFLGVLDRPRNTALDIAKYEIEYWENGVRKNPLFLNNTATSAAHTPWYIQRIPMKDNSVYAVRVRAIDKSGNPGGWKNLAQDYRTPDKTGPNAPTSL